MQTVLVTGANGFVGQFLVPQLLAEGFRVVATGRDSSAAAGPHASLQYLQLDFTDGNAANELVLRERPSVVVHCGALTKPDDCELHQQRAWQINVLGTANMLAAAGRVGAFFLHVSTDFVFAGDKPQYAEQDQPAPVNYYGYTKMEAEQRVRSYKGSWAIARPILVYGPSRGGRSNIVTMVADALRQEKPMRLFTDQLRMPTYVEDLAWGLAKMVAARSTGTYHFCGPDLLSPYDIGLAVANHMGANTGLIVPVTATGFKQPAARPPITVFSYEKANRVLGYQPTSFAVGLLRTLEGQRPLAR